jgi:hypothetical protein
LSNPEPAAGRLLRRFTRPPKPVASVAAALAVLVATQASAAMVCNPLNQRCTVTASQDFVGQVIPDGFSMAITAPNGPVFLTATNGAFGSGTISGVSDQYGPLPFDFYGTTRINGGSAGRLGAIASIFDTQGLVLTNHGNLVQQGSGQLDLLQNVQFNNTAAGTYQILNDNGIGGGVGVQASFQNQGALIKAGGAGTSLISTPFDQNGGRLEVWQGQVLLTGGGTQTNARFYADALANPVQAAGVGLVFGGSAANPFVFAGTVLTETGGMALQAGAVIQLAGTWVQNARFDNQSVLNLGSGATMSYYSPDAGVINSGVLNISAGASANFYNLENRASLNVVDNRLQVDNVLMLSGGTVRLQGLTTRAAPSTIASVNPLGGVLELDHADATVGSGLLTADPMTGAPGVIAAGSKLVLRNDATLTLSPLHATPGPAPTLVANAGDVELHDTARILGSDGTEALSYLQANQAGARLSLQDGAVVTLKGDLSNAGTLHVVTGGTLNAQNLSNSGTLIIGAGSTLNAQNLTQTDGVLTVDGVLDNGTAGGVTTLLGGVLNGNGSINGDLFVGGGPGTASFRPGHSPGHMTITGGLTLNAGGVLELEIQRGSDGLLHWDTVSANSMSFADGSLIKILVGTGVGATDAGGLDLLTCSGNCDFSGNVQIEGDSGGGSYALDASGLSLTLAAVPEPTPMTLLAAGLLFVFAAFRRRP